MGLFNGMGGAAGKGINIQDLLGGGYNPASAGTSPITGTLPNGDLSITTAPNTMPPGMRYTGADQSQPHPVLQALSQILQGAASGAGMGPGGQTQGRPQMGGQSQQQQSPGGPLQQILQGAMQGMQNSQRQAQYPPPQQSQYPWMRNGSI